MMAFLVLYVLDYRGNIRRAHAESTVAFLPDEFLSLFAHPFGGVRLDGEDCLGEGQRGRYLKKKVDVVFHPADGVYEYLCSLADASGIRPEALLHGAGNQSAPLFGAEDHMDCILNVGVRQSVAPPALEL